jgi:WD40 repeat protein
MPQTYDVFLSYSGVDQPTVEQIARRLRDEERLEPFLDRWHSIGGRPWQRDLSEALAQSRTCAVFLGSAGLGPWYEQEMWEALDRATKDQTFFVIPVLLPNARISEPKPPFLLQRTWVEFSRVDDADAFHRLVCAIRGLPPGPPSSKPASSRAFPQRSMVPFPEGFIRRREYGEVVDALCSHRGPSDPSAALIVALRGPGGFGKTALAQAVCHDPLVQRTFPDGALWTTMGADIDASGRLARILDLIRWWTEKETPSFQTVSAAGARLAEVLQRRRVLLVVDDVWSSSDLEPFRSLNANSALLVTLRVSKVLPPEARRIDVDAMAPPEAVELLQTGLPDEESKFFEALAQDLGNWALLLKLVNRELRELVTEDGLPMRRALQEVEAALKAEGLTAFDRDDPEASYAAVDRTLAVSWRRLTEPEQSRYRDLAAFRENVDVPLSVLERLWSVPQQEAVSLCKKLSDLSLLLSFDRLHKTIRLHGVFRQYLVRGWGDNLPHLHRRLLDSYLPATGRWADLPAGEAYLWRHLADHLLGAGEADLLSRLLLDFDFLKAKLRSTHIMALIADYASFEHHNEELRLIQRALLLSAHILERDKEQLSAQLLGRLLGREHPGILGLLQQARQGPGTAWLRPRTASLTPPGGALVRILEGYSGTIRSLALGETYLVCGLKSGALRVWNLESGDAPFLLEGHTSWVNAVAMVDDRQVVSASADRTLRVWDLERREARSVLQGHQGWVNAVAVARRHLVSASTDKTLRLWDPETGEDLGFIGQHESGIRALAVIDERSSVSASEDGSLRICDLEGRKVLRLLGHRRSRPGIEAIAVADGRSLVAAFGDHTLQVWSLETGEVLHTLQGHTGKVRAVAVTEDRRAISASEDETLRVWNLASGESLSVLKGHTQAVTAVAIRGKRMVSASEDGTMRIWSLESGETGSAKGYPSRIREIRVVSHGRVLISAENGAQDEWTLDGEIQRSISPPSPDPLWAFLRESLREIETEDGLTVWASGKDLGVRESRGGGSSWTLSLEAEVTALAFDPESRTLAVGDDSGRVHFLEIAR